MADLPTLDVRRRAAWRRWLARHHASSGGVWLVFHKPHSGAEAIPYEDSVREALCFGWIDSLIKRLDDDRYARKFTPRKPTSKWSDLNRRRWAELEAEGRLTAAGLAAGGLTFGVIADKLGRVRALNITVAIFSICSLGAATHT
jgi:uncharacterized protein YdeI (YjbR/CyaY-like superfamily)